MPMGASFFYFDLSATPDLTQLTDPPTLTIKVSLLKSISCMIGLQIFELLV
jgi:hypothetical protein